MTAFLDNTGTTGNYYLMSDEQVMVPLAATADYLAMTWMLTGMEDTTNSQSDGYKLMATGY